MSQNVYNQKLKAQVDFLVNKAFAFYNETMSHFPSAREPLQISKILHNLQLGIKKMDEYQKCITIMNEDEQIKSVVGKLVGTIAERTTIESADICLLRFIERLYIEFYDKKLEPDLINKQYATFEELFYSDKLRFRDTVRLCNFEALVNEIDLGGGLGIIKFPSQQDMRAHIEEIKYRPHLQFSRSEYIIERQYTRPKLLGPVAVEPSVEQLTRELGETGDEFDLIIKTLRILKSSAIYRDRHITTETLTYMPYSGTTIRAPFDEVVILGDKCALSSQEVIDLKMLHSRVKQTKDKSFVVASNRLGFGMERKSDEDRLLDFMIGLEALYLPDDRDELTFKLSLRVAFVMNQEMTIRKQTFKFMKSMYKIRSSIAHGKKSELTKPGITRLEELLRQSLRIYLDKPEFFRSEALDNIYFS